MRRIIFAVLTIFALGTVPAAAVFSGDMSPRPPSGDKDYAEAVEAKSTMEWETMVAALERVVARRPWHDNAHNLLGYGYRKLGDFDRALHHYAIALDLNPRHRLAMAYLGVAYLHMERVDEAEATLERLSGVCQFVALTFSDGEFTDGCNEYRRLSEDIAFYKQNGYLPEDCPGDWK